ncbi:MAG: nicotinate-nucleotide adenylyltransferase [Chloroflexota bacterium]|nr:nicotinate-nucleotide adenylyltransferase [Dehalococcoidia bacterium]MDW8254171.1 nicotinate-nucleotide adenylyltransferase [Chloroflexota bacterium]
MRLGVLGGTFDPVHLGHLIVAESAREAAQLDRVLFVPAGQPWHRGERPHASAADRLAMVERAIAGNPAFAVSRVDIDRPGPTYTVDTLEALRRQYPDAALILLLGQDALAQFASWREPARIAQLGEIVAFARPGAPPIDLAALHPAIPDAPLRVRFLDSPQIGISATMIRARVQAGHSIRYLTPDPVVAYIAQRRLYRRGQS